VNTIVVFSLLALGHAIRLIFGWYVTVEKNMVVPNYLHLMTG
jgi:hypothetical protein